MRIYDYQVRDASTTPLGSTSGVSSAQQYAANRRSEISANSDHASLSSDGALLRSGAQSRAARIEALTASVRAGNYNIDPAAISKSLVGESIGRAE